MYLLWKIFLDAHDILRVDFKAKQGGDILGMRFRALAGNRKHGSLPKTMIHVRTVESTCRQLLRIYVYYAVTVSCNAALYITYTAEDQHRE